MKEIDSVPKLRLTLNMIFFFLPATLMTLKETNYSYMDQIFILKKLLERTSMKKNLNLKKKKKKNPTCFP